MKTVLRSCWLLLLCNSLAGTAQVPVMNSYPAAVATVFLDFDGHTVSGSSWNTSGPIHCTGAGLTSTQVTEVFNRVAEDYRPFKINITTDSVRYLTAPLDKRMRVIVTTTSWWGQAGGVSFVGSFSWGDDTPCFVFSEVLNFNVKNVSEATAHEAGHTLGLFHQSTYNDSCVKTSEYNFGQGTGEIGWAPIMGVGYYQNFTLWYDGPNPFGCTNYQSDLDIIVNGNGITLRDDDHPDDFAGAVNATISNSSFLLNGVVERRTDIDFFKFNLLLPGRLQLNAIPFSVGVLNAGSNLDLQVSLYNGSQMLLKVSNPGTQLNSVMDTLLDPGIYYLKVEGTGNTNATDYASLGSYSLQGNIIDAVLPLRKLELQGSVNNGEHRLSWIIDADEQITELSVEILNGGSAYTTLADLATSARSYANRPSTTGTVLYRLHVVFDNGRQYYSNVVALRSKGDEPRPRLVSNFLQANRMEITSPGGFNYAVCDLRGTVLAQGKLPGGSNLVSLPALASGMYVIRYEHDGRQWTEKFVLR
jgi:hypothetical protein